VIPPERSEGYVIPQERSECRDLPSLRALPGIIGTIVDPDTRSRRSLVRDDSDGVNRNHENMIGLVSNRGQ
ncbi:MAG: hypothetical protein ABJE10_07425, partial [bacterium]